MSRWSRATAAIREHVPTGARILDVGAAWGFGTAPLSREYELHALDIKPEYVKRSSPDLAGRLIASATALPYRDGSFNAVLCLEVLEHIPNPAPAVAEIARVLRPGGLLVVSVPNRGLLWLLDSNNVGARFFDPGEIVPAGWRHHHFRPDELNALLMPEFDIVRVQYTGTGIAEPLHLPVLAVTRGLKPLRRFYSAAAFIYYSGALVDDLLPTGRWGYNAMVTARRR